MLKLPFQSPYRPTVTQVFAGKEYIDWYKKNGINIPFHNGIDVVFGNNKQTFGTPCVNPFDSATVIQLWYESPNSTQGNGVKISGEHNGYKYEILFWHTCELETRFSNGKSIDKLKVGQTLTKGEIVCYIGNSGLVMPTPTKENPFAGAHCHLGLLRYSKVNGVWQALPDDWDNGIGGYRNPLELFILNDWFTTISDSGEEHDIYATLPFVKFVDNVLDFFKRLGILK